MKSSLGKDIFVSALIVRKVDNAQAPIPSYVFIHKVQLLPLPIVSQMPSISDVKFEHVIAAHVFLSMPHSHHLGQ